MIYFDKHLLYLVQMPISSTWRYTYYTSNMMGRGRGDIYCTKVFYNHLLWSILNNLLRTVRTLTQCTYAIFLLFQIFSTTRKPRTKFTIVSIYSLIPFIRLVFAHSFCHLGNKNSTTACAFCWWFGGCYRFEGRRWTTLNFKYPHLYT